MTWQDAPEKWQGKFCISEAYCFILLQQQENKAAAARSRLHRQLEIDEERVARGAKLLGTKTRALLREKKVTACGGAYDMIAVWHNSCAVAIVHTCLTVIDIINVGALATAHRFGKLRALNDCEGVDETEDTCCLSINEWHCIDPELPDNNAHM